MRYETLLGSVAPEPGEFVLVTGFGRFSGHGDNPSSWLANDLATYPPRGLRVASQILPVAYDEAAVHLASAIDKVRPRAVIAFGLDFAADMIVLEIRAINADDAPQPDARGVLRRGQVIDQAAAPWLDSSLPAPSILGAFAGAGIPIRTSQNAGGYVCNHVFFTLRNRYPQLLGGFLHLPPDPAAVDGLPGRSGLSRTALRRAGCILLAVIARATER